MLYIFLGVVLVFLGFYTALYKNYYRWDSPLIKQKYLISHPRVNIFVDQKFKRIVPEIIGQIKKNTSKNDYIFIFPNAPMFYFLTERKNPTRYINFAVDLGLSGREEKVVEDIKKKDVRLILTHGAPESWRNPLISKYILENFRKKKEVFEFTLWEIDESERRSAVRKI